MLVLEIVSDFDFRISNCGDTREVILWPILMLAKHLVDYFAQPIVRLRWIASPID
jgi:hypothetical protein